VPALSEILEVDMGSEGEEMTEKKESLPESDIAEAISTFIHIVKKMF